MANFATVSPGTRPFSVYVSDDDANTFLEGQPNLGDEWVNLEQKRKFQWIIQASYKMDTLNWKGDRVAKTQARAWPRTNSGYTGDENFPDEVKDATALLAAYLAFPGMSPAVIGVNPSIKKVVGAQAEVEFFHADTVMPQPVEDGFQQEILDLVRCYLGGTDNIVVAGGSSGSVAVPDSANYFYSPGSNPRDTDVFTSS